MPRIVILIVLILVGCDSSSRLARMRAVDTAQMITLDEAIAIARAEIPGGFPIEAVLEVEDDDEVEPPAYEVVLFVAATDRIMEVEVHAMTGAVLEVEVSEDGDGEN